MHYICMHYISLFIVADIVIVTTETPFQKDESKYHNIIYVLLF